MCKMFHQFGNLTRGWLTVSCRALVCPESGSPRGFRREAMESQRRRDRGDQEVCQAETEAVSHRGEIIDPSEPPLLSRLRK